MDKYSKRIKNNLVKNIRKNKGITLIALVVTIIVLMILAGVAVAALMGNNGLITRSGEAKESQRGAAVLDEVKLAISENKMIDEINKTTGVTGGLKTKSDVIDELVTKGYLTEDDRATLATTDTITIGSVTIDFSGLAVGSRRRKWFWFRFRFRKWLRNRSAKRAKWKAINKSNNSS